MGNVVAICLFSINIMTELDIHGYFTYELNTLLILYYGINCFLRDPLDLKQL